MIARLRSPKFQPAAIIRSCMRSGCGSTCGVPVGVSAETALSLDEALLAAFPRIQAGWPDRGRVGLRAGQHSAVEDGVAKIGSAKIRAAEIGTMQIRPVKR